jgi:hypothetical protein
MEIRISCYCIDMVISLNCNGKTRELSDDFTMYIPHLLYFGESSSETNIYDPLFVSRQIYVSLKRK